MSTGVQATPSRRRFDVDDYHAMVRAGILEEGDRVELIDGEIVEMHAIGSRHWACVVRLNRLLVTALGTRGLVSVQSSLRLDRFSQPEPDVAVVEPRADDYATALPEPPSTLLLIEVADTSLDYDREIKNPWVYSTGAGVTYTITSTGADGAAGPPPPRPWPDAPFEPDIVLTDGQFAQGPLGR